MNPDWCSRPPSAHSSLAGTEHLFLKIQGLTRRLVDSIWVQLRMSEPRHNSTVSFQPNSVGLWRRNRIQWNCEIEHLEKARWSKESETASIGNPLFCTKFCNSPLCFMLSHDFSRSTREPAGSRKRTASQPRVRHSFLRLTQPAKLSASSSTPWAWPCWDGAKQTWNLKIAPLKSKIIFQTSKLPNLHFWVPWVPC